MGFLQLRTFVRAGFTLSFWFTKGFCNASDFTEVRLNKRQRERGEREGREISLPPFRAAVLPTVHHRCVCPRLQKALPEASLDAT